MAEAETAVAESPSGVVGADVSELFTVTLIVEEVVVFPAASLAVAVKE